MGFKCKQWFVSHTSVVSVTYIWCPRVFYSVLEFTWCQRVFYSVHEFTYAFQNTLHWILYTSIRYPVCTCDYLRESLVEKWLFTLLVHLSWLPVFVGFALIHCVFCVVFCWSLFALSLLAIVVLSVFWFANSDYNINISMFNLFIQSFKQFQEIKKISPSPNTVFVAVFVKSKFYHQIDTHDINVLYHYMSAVFCENLK